ncbi:aldo/keto reductase [Salinimicrobium sediminilitoris]|uniref:aldo/keto reductase n=1 Tax=Salinimicrobium sediminilitoris TaxID=2876715 RepID=UPI001E4A1021|nr:aldo/keto reductase [Salinimicrobium sediminilitoris]MCC8359142.1 aldo/keto reductase [Salinimicrobium sediminilitoris]
MLKKPLGSTGLEIAPIVFGGNVFGWTLDEKESFRMLDKIFEKGFNSIDTADSYSHWAPGNHGGESETIIGKWLKERGNRDEIFLATKVGSNPGKEGRDISKKYILKAAEDSLRRLQTDHIDLYFTHWDNENTPVEETLEAYEQLIKQGKVGHIGASNLSPERISASLKAANQNDLPKYEVIQPEYNLVEKEKFEGQYKPLAEENNLAVITYFSLASGFLTGKYRKKEDLEGAREEMVKKYFNDKGLNKLKTLDEISKAHQVSNAAVALRWLMQQPAVTAPIASATEESHLNAFEEAVNMKLSPQEMNRLSE